MSIPPPPPSSPSARPSKKSRWGSFGTTYTSSGHLDWRTPRFLFDHLNREFLFTIDAAADKTNALCPVWFGPGGLHEDALAVEWRTHRRSQECAFLNPPYGRDIHRWYAKVVEESRKSHMRAIVMLVNANTETDYWWEYVWSVAAEIRFIHRRVNFEPPPGYKPRKDKKGRVKKDAQTKGSAILVYRPERLVPYPIVSCIDLDRIKEAA